MAASDPAPAGLVSAPCRCTALLCAQEMHPRRFRSTVRRQSGCIGAPAVSYWRTHQAEPCKALHNPYVVPYSNSLLIIRQFCLLWRLALMSEEYRVSKRQIWPSSSWGLRPMQTGPTAQSRWKKKKKKKKALQKKRKKDAQAEDRECWPVQPIRTPWMCWAADSCMQERNGLQHKDAFLACLPSIQQQAS